MSLFKKFFGIISKKRLRDEAFRINSEGAKLYQLEQWQEALHCYNNALAIWSEIGDRLGQAAALSNIGTVYLATNQLQEAQRRFEEVLSLYREVEDRESQGIVLSNLATTYASLGQLQQAKLYSAEALTIAREVGNRPTEAATLSDMGKVHTDLGELQEALYYREEALVIWREIGDRIREADTLQKLGALRQSSGQPQEALRYYSQALDIWRDVGNQEFEVDALHEMGSVYRDQGQYRESLRCFSAIVEICRTLNDRLGEGTALAAMAANYEELDQPQENLRYLNLALAVWQEIGESSLETSSLIKMGDCLCLLGQFEESMRSYREALAISKELGNREKEGTTLIGMGKLLDNLGKLQEAFHCFEEALAISKELGDETNEGNALSGIGVVYYRRAQYEKALNIYNESLTIARKLGDKNLEASILNNISAVYDGLGQHPQSLRFLEQALQISRELGERTLEGTILCNIGEQHHDLGQYQGALHSYEDALKVLRETGYRAGEAVTLQNIGELYRDLNQPKDALRFNEAALALSQEVGDRLMEASTLINMGTLYYNTQPREALGYYENALGILREIGDRFRTGITLGNVGSLYHQLGEYPKACQHLEEACQIFENIRQGILTDESRANFFAPQQYDFSHYVRALMRWYQKDKKRKHAAKAFHVRERRAARALIDLIVESRVGLRYGLDEAYVRERDDLLEELTYAQECYRQPGLSEQARKLYLSQREEISLRLSRLEARIRAENPHYASLTQLNALTLTQVQEQLLDRETVLFEFALEPEVSFLWAVTKDKWQVYFLPPVGEIRKIVEEFLNILRRGSTNLSEAAYNLYKILLKSAIEFIEGTRYKGMQKHPKKLIIIPDDILFSLPFESLLTEPPEVPNLTKSDPQAVSPSTEFFQANEDGPMLPPYLLCKFSIVYAPSATVLSTVRQERGTTDKMWEKEFIGFAPVVFRSAKILKNTVKEVKGIASLFPAGKATEQVHGDATKQVVQSILLKQYRYVHFATHGYLDSDNPQFCGLLFPDADDDHLLHTFEIFELDLDADLVTASACLTGLGKYVQGEGMMGLMRAFFYAGTPSVCVSLWSVADDSTSHLMQNFYRLLVAGKDKAEALQLAKQEMLGKSLWGHPYFWAPFVLVGNWQ